MGRSLRGDGEAGREGKVEECHSVSLGHRWEDSLHSSRPRSIQGDLSSLSFSCSSLDQCTALHGFLGCFKLETWTHILLGQPPSTRGCRRWLLLVPRCPSDHWGPPSPPLPLSKRIPHLLCGLYPLSILSAHSRENSPVPSFAYSL